jgi:RNA polymerase sigma-70 factor (ECF subfamily)
MRAHVVRALEANNKWRVQVGGGMAEQSEVLHAIRACSERGDYQQATRLTVRIFGPEILDFLRAVHRDTTQSADVFSLWAEGVWRGFASFLWQSSLRTWIYAIARMCSLRYRRDLRRLRARQRLLPEVVALLDLPVDQRSETPWYRTTELRSRFAELRTQLDPDDQMMLLLRVEQRLAWSEIARIMLTVHDAQSPSEQELVRGAARLRKHFQGVKERIYQLARQHGLLASDGAEPLPGLHGEVS